MNVLADELYNVLVWYVLRYFCFKMNISCIFDIFLYSPNENEKKTTGKLSWLLLKLLFVWINHWGINLRLCDKVQKKLGFVLVSVRGGFDLATLAIINIPIQLVFLTD